MDTHDRQDDQTVRDQEEAAAAEAGRIGGKGSAQDLDPEEQAVAEGGGGQAEGFEQAEDALVENASHGDGTGSPEADEFTPEAESDRSGAEYGEADDAGDHEDS